MEEIRFRSRHPPDGGPDPRREVHRHPQGHFPLVRLLLGGLQEVLLVLLRQVVLRWVVLRHGLHLGFCLGLLLGLRLLHRRRLGLVDPVALWGFVQGVWRNAMAAFSAIVQCTWVESYLGSLVLWAKRTLWGVPWVCLHLLVGDGALV